MSLVLTGAGAGGASTIIMLLVMFAIMYFLIIRPENKRKKKAEAIRNSVKNGTKITTIGGLVGDVVQVTEDTVTFETGEDRVRIQIKKWAISTSDSYEEVKK
ncbi:MAG: preprotein translocase subunit YajC [Oscillospiraceae bacterium]|nr:preprotein translocase subunit YajC [Oscillospiraceae bacterium]